MACFSSLRGPRRPRLFFLTIFSKFNSLPGVAAVSLRGEEQSF